MWPAVVQADSLAIGVSASIALVWMNEPCVRILLERSWGNRCWAACRNVSGKSDADQQAGSHQFPKA